jgi:hypothetical protein
MITANIQRQEISRIAQMAKKFQAEAKLATAKELARSAYKIDADAKVNAQRNITNLGGLIGQIRTEPVSSDSLTWVNRSGAKYSAYIEFGTGRTVDLSNLVKAGFPASWAMQFKGKGIRKLNLQPRPFLFPAINAEQPKLRTRLIKVLKQNAKKF